jgi:hypothetical protein
MRKFLWVVAVGVLLLAVAAPAMAVDVKFGGEWRVRFYDYGNLGFNDVQGTNPRGVQLRFRPRFDVSDDNGNITATWRGEYGDTEFGNGGGANNQALGVTKAGATVVGSNGVGGYQVVSGSNRVGNGAGGGAGGDGVALETKWAYIDFAMPFKVPLRVRTGLQYWYLPKGLVTDDDYAGVRAYGSVAPISYEFAWFRANRGTTTGAAGGASYCAIGGAVSTAIITKAACDLAGGTWYGLNNSGAMNSSTKKDNAFDYYEVKFDAALSKLINPYVYYVYGDNRSNCTGNDAGTYKDNAAACAANSRVRPQHFFGLGLTGDAGAFSYDLDWVWGRAEGGIQGTMYSAADGQPIMVQGWALDGGVHIPIGPAKLHLIGSYASGDKQDASGHKSSAFPGGPGTSWSGPSRPAAGPFEIIGEGGDFDVFSVNHTPTGLWTIGAAVEYLPVKALTLRAGYLLIGFTDKTANCAYTVTGSIGCFGPSFSGKDYTTTTGLGGTGGLAGKTMLGQELDLRADYTIWTGFKIQAMTAWLMPTKGDTTGKYILQFYYNF